MLRGYFNMRLFFMLACICIYTNPPTDTRRTQFWFEDSWKIRKLTLTLTLTIQE